MTASAPAPTLAPKSGNYRWRICAILFIATTINYVDRNVLSFTMRDDGFRRVMLDLPAGAPLGAAEIAQIRLARIHHTFLKKSFCHRVHRGPNRGHGAKHLVRSVASMGRAPYPL